MHYHSIGVFSMRSEPLNYRRSLVCSFSVGMTMERCAFMQMKMFLLLPAAH